MEVLDNAVNTSISLKNSEFLNMTDLEPTMEELLALRSKMGSRAFSEQVVKPKMQKIRGENVETKGFVKHTNRFFLFSLELYFYINII